MLNRAHIMKLAGILLIGLSSASVQAVPIPSLYVSNHWGANILKFDYHGSALPGVKDTGFTAGISRPQGLAYRADGADGIIYGVSSISNTIRRFNAKTGASVPPVPFIGLGSPGEGGGLTSAPNGDLYVTQSGPISRVLWYNHTDESPSVFVSGLNQPHDLTFGPDGYLYVADAGSGQVLVFDSTGAPVRSISVPGVGGVAFGPDGKLYASGNNKILRYLATGAFDTEFVPSVESPYGLTFGPDGNLYVASVSTGTVKRYNGSTGADMDIFASGLNSPTHVLFIPEPGTLSLLALGGLAVMRRRR